MNFGLRNYLRGWNLLDGGMGVRKNSETSKLLENTIQLVHERNKNTILGIKLGGVHSTVSSRGGGRLGQTYGSGPLRVIKHIGNKLAKLVLM
jgi:hypothetical protein